MIIEIVAVIAFVVLLASAIYMLVSFYICDSHNCKAFNDAAKVGPPGSKEYVVAVLNGMFNDGIWPIPYIGASILTPLGLWFMNKKITIYDFAILFFVSFVVIYFMFSFFGHHYIKFITQYVIQYIEDDCPNVTGDAHNNMC